MIFFWKTLARVSLTMLYLLYYLRIQQIKIKYNNESDTLLIFPHKMISNVLNNTNGECSRQKYRAVIREDYFANKPAGFLSKHT